jgi:hypothetical protein
MVDYWEQKTGRFEKFALSGLPSLTIARYNVRVIPLLSDRSEVSKRVRRNNSGKYYGKFHPYLVRRLRASPLKQHQIQGK